MISKVLVMMTTYNGEKYLREQIDSVLAQKDVNVFIKVADDRSTDSTVIILEDYKKKYDNFDYCINEHNKGFTYNFIDLLFSVDDAEKYDYFAFCDQDDYWLPNKLSAAISKIKDSTCEKGILYCSNLTLVDENLIKFGMQEDKKVLKAKKYSFLTSNLATGCTIVFNQRFYKHITQVYPKDIYLHDYWVFLIAVFTAEYYYDFNSYILYRQHSNNQIGSNKKTFTKSKIKEALHPIHKTSNLISKLYEYYKLDIYEEDKKYVYLAATYNLKFKNKMKLLFSKKIKRYKLNIFFKIKVLLGKY